MGAFWIKLIRRYIHKIIGPNPWFEHNIDYLSARRQAIDNAIGAVDLYTRLSRNNKPAGTKGSLLGDYLEFGCYRGESFIYAFRHASPLMPWMKFYAFDSFQGLPKLKTADPEEVFWEGQFAYSQEDFTDNLKKAGVDLRRIRCIPGWFDDTLSKELKNKMNLTVASIVHIDCDLYQSCVPVLEFLTDIIETGSVIIFDDWFCYKADPQKGVMRACREWLSRNPGITLQDWHLVGAYGKSFIAQVK